jgi:hypothetical protein
VGGVKGQEVEARPQNEPFVEGWWAWTPLEKEGPHRRDVVKRMANVDTILLEVKKEMIEPGHDMDRYTESGVGTGECRRRGKTWLSGGAVVAITFYVRRSRVSAVLIVVA